MNLSVRPDLLIILLVFFAVHSNPYHAIITSFTIGFAADLIGTAMGPQIISFGLLGSALAHLRKVVAVRNMIQQGIAIFILGLLAGALAALLTRLKGEPLSTGIYAFIIKTSACSAIVGPFLFLPAAWWMRMRTRRFGRY
jgi:rod shape-determining protein MreD